jgi:hypothetical protein
MLLVCRGCLGRGENPDFLTFCLLADVENHELPCQFLRRDSPYFSASSHLFRHGFLRWLSKSQGTTGQTMCVAKCCARQTCTHQIEASWMAEKTLTTTNVTPSEPLGPRYPTDWPLSPLHPWAR